MKLSVLVLALTCSCSLQQAKSADQTAINLTNAVCALAPDSPVGQPYVEVVCTIAEAVEQTVAVVIGQLPQGGAAPDAGAAVASTVVVPVKQIRFRLPAESASTFLAAHKSR